MKRRKLAWMVASKIAFTLAVMLPASPRGTVEYRAFSPLPGVRAGTPVTLYGTLIGQVVAKNRRGDTTFLSIRFERRAEHLPGSRSVGLRWMGLGQGVALEIQPVRRPGDESFAGGGWLEVIPPDRYPHWRPELVRPRLAPPEQSPWRESIPTVPGAPRWAPPAST